MSKRYLKLKNKEERWGREKCIWTEMKTCDICGQNKKCVISDSSDGEYLTMSICLDCTKKAIEGEI